MVIYPLWLPFALTSCGGDDGVSYDVNVVSYADESPNVVFSGGDI